MAIDTLIPWRRSSSLFSSPYSSSPASSLSSLQREMNRMFNNMWFSPSLVGEAPARDEELFSPDVEMFETDGHIAVAVELPGVDQQDIDVTLSPDGSAISIRGEKRMHYTTPGMQNQQQAQGQDPQQVQGQQQNQQQAQGQDQQQPQETRGKQSKQSKQNKQGKQTRQEQEQEQEQGSPQSGGPKEMEMERQRQEQQMQGQEPMPDTHFYCAERMYGAFRRTLTLPTRVNPDEVEATFRNGVLEIMLNKLDTSSRGVKHIEIK